MLEKLLSHLPYNPSLVYQLAFYSKRMRQEASIRRLGVVFLALAFVVQFVVVINPPQTTGAARTNDLVDGGFTSAAEAAGDCQRNLPVDGGPGYGTILAYYGITCAQVAAAPTVHINSSEWNNQLWSMGRNDYSWLPGETPVTIGGTNLYVRYLWGWGANVPYPALNVTKPGGQTFLLLYSCGNITSVGFPTPPPAPKPAPVPPALKISKAMTPGYPVANGSYAPGTVLSYRLSWNNNGGTATNVTVKDNKPAYMDDNLVSKSTANSAGFDSSQNAYWKFNSMPAGAQNWYVDVRYKISANAPNGTRICNSATISSSQTAPSGSNQVCVTVKLTPPPVVTTPPPPPPPCKAAINSQSPYACVVPHKAAANTTQNISDADGTTAQAGDVIVYTLSADNTGTAKVKQYPFQENISDVLDYADIVDLHGGSFNSATQVVSWPAQDIAANQTLNHQITVKVKDPIPQNPTSPSDPMHFDLKMVNSYGNTITINLPNTPIRTAAVVTTKLPNTGPGSSLLIAGAIVVVAGYFAARSRLLAKEANLAAHNSTSGGV